MTKNPVVHFEMPYEDLDRLSKFYNSAFAWDMSDAGENMGHYVVAVTSDDDNKAINGGFYKKSKSNNPYPSFVISVENIKEAIEKIKKAGGKIISEPNEIPGIGMWAVFLDTEGNKVSILQPKMN